jgi:pimeloyl-ACP methyl ester carboxylesterase
VTVAWGAKDRILPPHQAERARELLPEARHVALPGCGHVPMTDDPDLVADLILQTTRSGWDAKADDAASAAPVPETRA